VAKKETLEKDTSDKKEGSSFQVKEFVNESKEELAKVVWPSRNLEQRIHTLDVADRILQVQIPQAATVKVRKDGSRQHGEEKVFPGYVLIKMIMDDDAWQVVKNTPHVINFVGAEQKRHYGRGRGHVTPLPLSMSEVDRKVEKQN